jgi:hypothetical protein
LLSILKKIGENNKRHTEIRQTGLSCVKKNE